MQRVVRGLWVEALTLESFSVDLGFWADNHSMLGRKPCRDLQIPNRLEAKEEVC